MDPSSIVIGRQREYHSWAQLQAGKLVQWRELVEVLLWCLCSVSWEWWCGETLLELEQRGKVWNGCSRQRKSGWYGTLFGLSDRTRSSAAWGSWPWIESLTSHSSWLYFSSHVQKHWLGQLWKRWGLSFTGFGVSTDEWDKIRKRASEVKMYARMVMLDHGLKLTKRNLKTRKVWKWKKVWDQ